MAAETDIRQNWKHPEVAELYELPFTDLLYQAQTIHRRYFDPNTIQTSTLISIKTGACPEDCAYCPQSAHYKTNIALEKLLSVSTVIEYAKRAQENGATRFCMGAAWRVPKARDLAIVCEMIKEVKKLGLQTCVTLGMLTQDQAQTLKGAGLDYYNHNLDTSPDFYPEIISTRTYQDRLDTLENVRQATIKVCCGGIIGMGENRDQRIGLLINLANQPSHPQSVPINLLSRVPGTPLEHAAHFDTIEFIRTVAVARILMPKSYVRLSAGRSTMSDEMQALCFFAGANSIHYGEEKLLTTDNPSVKEDLNLFERLGIKALDQHTLDKQECLI
jgi:biotin synthase